VDQELAILTPDKAVLTYRVAGLGPRIGAHLLDILIVFSIIYGLSTGLTLLALATRSEVWMGAILMASSLVPFLYFILLEGLWSGQTVGKKAARIRVTMADGTPVTFGAALSRNLLRPADLLPGVYLVGIAAIFLNPRSQRLGDLAAGTVVVLEKRSESYYALTPHKAGIHPLEQYVGDLKGMTDEEYLALRRYADRFPELPQRAQDRLTQDVFLPIAERRNIPKMPNVHPIFLAEAAVMRYGRERGLL